MVSKTIEKLRDMQIIKDVRDPAIAGYKEVDVVCFDIETHTNVKTHWSGHDLKDFGLSVLSPPREVALWHPDLPPVVLDFSLFDPYAPENTPEYIYDQIEWLRDVMTRPHITTVGHNVIFDWRNIGVHFEMSPHPQSRVWDTLTIGIRMGLGALPHKKSPFSNSFALDALAQRMGFLKYGTEMYEFYSWMKEQRSELSNLANALAQMPEGHVVWSLVGGFIPPNRSDLFDRSAQRLIDIYAMADAAYTYRIYEKQNHIAQVLQTQDYVLDWQEAVGKKDEVSIKTGRFRYPKYPELTLRDPSPGFESQLDFVTRLLRVKCQQAIRGIPVDLEYTEGEITRREQRIIELRAEVLDKSDPHDPYPEFERIFSMMLYFNQITDVLRGETKVSFSNPKNWFYWKPLHISQEVVRDALHWDIPIDEKSKQDWVNFLNNDALTIVENDTGSGAKIKGATLKAAPKTTPPRIDLMAWVHRNCFYDKDSSLAYFLSRIKTDWLSYFYTITRNDVVNAGIERLHDMIELTSAKLPYDRDFLREELAKKNSSMAPEIYDYCLEVGELAMHEDKFLNMDKWKPYYMYCVAAAPLPNSEELKYNSALTTKRFGEAVKQYRSANDNQEPEDYQLLALREWCFSYGKGAMDFFIGEESMYAEDTQELRPLRELTQVQADKAMLVEIRAHAQLTGKVHSITAPKARTQRMTSVSPNMQNKKFGKDSPIIGVFVAPEGMTAFENDAGSVEVAISNATAADHAGAEAREGVDLHLKRAEMYWSDEWEHLDFSTRKKYRQMGKRVTFGDLYAAGAYLIATQIGVSVNVAYKLMEKLHESLWRTEEKKKQVADNCIARYNAGANPPFVTNWAGTRIYVPLTKDWHSDNVKPMTYTTWNYVVQSSVPDMLGRAMVLISEMLESEGYKTYIAHEVHDAIIIHFDDHEFLHPEEYGRDIAVEICRIFCNQIPETFLRRTTPKTHIIASLCPSNRFKWGYRHGVEYPYPKDIFINEWGRFKLPDDVLAKDEKEWEAPDWFGNVAAGWTLEAETEAIRAERHNKKMIEVLGDGEVAATSSGDCWYELNDMLAEYNTTNQAVRNAINMLLRPYELTYNDSNDVPVKTGKMVFPVFMDVAHSLFHRGADEVYRTRMMIIKTIIENDVTTFGQWLVDNQKLFEILQTEAASG